jgi:hypothetical protein
VIVNDGQVEIRYVVPTGPKGETTPFCHLRLDYLNPFWRGQRHGLASWTRGRAWVRYRSVLRSSIKLNTRSSEKPSRGLRSTPGVVAPVLVWIF